MSENRHRKLSDCSCTNQLLIKSGFDAKEINGHHRLCSVNFKTIKDWRSAQSDGSSREAMAALQRGKGGAV